MSKNLSSSSSSSSSSTTTSRGYHRALHARLSLFRSSKPTSRPCFEYAQESMSATPFYSLRSRDAAIIRCLISRCRDGSLVAWIRCLSKLKSWRLPCYQPTLGHVGFFLPASLLTPKGLIIELIFITSVVHSFSTSSRAWEATQHLL
jgi:hypothetical protein